MASKWTAAEIKAEAERIAALVDIKPEDAQEAAPPITLAAAMPEAAHAPALAQCAPMATPPARKPRRARKPKLAPLSILAAQVRTRYADRMAATTARRNGSF